jgi:hypothetical protein
LNHDAWSDRLSEYLDGDLSPDEHAACEAHLANCADCTRALDSLHEVVAGARALPDRAPSQDLWPEIQKRLASGSAAPRMGRIFTFRLPRHIHLSLPQALAAGFALVALSSGLVWWALRHELPGPSGGAGTGSDGLTAVRPQGASGQPAGPNAAPSFERPALRGTGAGASGSTSDAARYAAYEAHYDQAIAELEHTLQEHRSELDTSTVRIVTQDLVIIDRAIEQARRALENDPASPYLHQHLALQMKLKLDLLRRTAAFTGGQG